MPIRPRRQRRLRIEWTPDVVIALTIGPTPGRSTPTDKTLRAAWEAAAAYLLVDCPPDRRPWAWWRFEPGVPQELRGERPTLYPVEHAGRMRVESHGLEVHRAAWLEEVARTTTAGKAL